jgi:hypothetical protein
MHGVQPSCLASGWDVDGLGREPASLGPGWRGIDGAPAGCEEPYGTNVWANFEGSVTYVFVRVFQTWWLWRGFKGCLPDGQRRINLNGDVSDLGFVPPHD